MGTSINFNKDLGTKTGTNISLPTGSSFENLYSFPFDGNNDFIDCGNDSSLQFTGTMTASAWVKTTETGSFEMVLGKDAISPATSRSFMLYRSTNYARFLVFPTSGGNSLVTSTSVINDGNWHHMVGVNDGTDLKIYVDGVLEAVNSGGGGSTLGGTTGELNIGRRPSAPAHRGYWTGNIDEVSLWNTALTDGGVSVGQTAGGQIAQIYNSGAPSDLSALNPISWWRMGDAANYASSTWTLTDQGSAGNDATSTTIPNTAGIPSTDVPT